MIQYKTLNCIVYAKHTVNGGAINKQEKSKRIWKVLIFMFICIIIFPDLTFSKDLYVYATTSPVVQTVNVRVYIDGKKLVKIKEGHYWYGDIGDRSSCVLKMKSGTYMSNRSIKINFQNKDAAFVMIDLGRMSWSVKEQSYSNVPNELKVAYNQRMTEHRARVHPNTGYNLNSFKNYLDNSTLPIEGLYENAIGSQTLPKYEIGVLKSEFGYTLIYLGGGDSRVWKEGDVKAYLTTTANSNLFKVKWYKADKTITENLYVSFDYAMMKVVWTDGNPESLFLKLYPTSDNYNNPSQERASSGTGFALSSNGYIITNYHVIDKAKSIEVKGINGNFTRKYSAKVVVSDERNDLAIIKINDPNFTTLGSLPYTFKREIAGVGENVFVLGYPMPDTMGEEIKLTNGVISARTGFQGDVSTYQISAPVQSGNSGGPLFDKNGNIIGVVSSKHLIADNAGYAIKVGYIVNLIELLPQRISLPQTSILNGKTLPQQVDIASEFTYLILVQR